MCADVRKDLSLRQGLLDSLHNLEVSAHELSHTVTLKLQALSRAVSHPGSAWHNISASLPHNASAAIEVLRTHLPDVPAGRPTNTCAKHEEALDPIIAAIKLASSSAEDSTHADEAASHEPLLLKLWLKDIVSRSIQWPAPRWPFLVFMVGAMACLLFSSACHLLCCCSKHVYVAIWRLDYAGAHLLVKHLCANLYQDGRVYAGACAWVHLCWT